jgi:N-acyl-D-aspartate/D-glutamate deacylase
VLYQRGQRLSQPLRHKQIAHLRQAVPDLAEQVLAEAGWYALAATLADTESAGHDPAALLAEAAERRELDTADSISDVLVWRLRRMADLPADASAMPEPGATAAAQTNGRTAKASTTRTDRPRNPR